MIEYVFALVVLAAVVLLFVGTRKQRSGSFRQVSEGQTMVYKHGYTDVVAESYYPAIIGSVGPFPMGKKEEREKTETFQNRPK